jgi:hypothetical protein
MKKTTLYFSLCVIILFYIPAPAEFCPALGTDPAVDAFLNRVASRYNVPLPASFFAQPMTVCDVLLFLDKADSLAAAGRLLPAEIFDARMIRKRISADYGLVKWKSSKMDAHVNVRLDLTDSNSASFGAKNAQYIRGMASPALNANLGKLSFYSGVDVWTGYRSDTMYQRSSYQPYNGVPYNLYNRVDSSRVRASDMLRGGIVYNAAPFRFDAAIDRIKQGPGIMSPLTFSGNAPPETYVRGQLSFGILDYTQTVGQLESEKDKPKYFYTHRINVPLFKNRVTLGLTEVVINGSTTNQQDSASRNALRKDYYGVTRNWEIGYMIPFVPYVFMEHYLGDRDNKVLSFDCNIAFPDNFRWYGELFIDDMANPWALFFSNDWGNKYAIDVGGQYFASVMSRDVTASVEFCRVEPWVYTHFYGGSHRYDNFNVCLGAPLGPNSYLLALTCDARVTPRNCVGISFTNEAANHIQRGGNITDVFQDPGTVNPDSPKKVFLDPKNTGTTTRVGAYWKFDQFGMFHAALKYEYDFSGKSEIQLYGGLYF